jgi:hypothetical protein
MKIIIVLIVVLFFIIFFSRMSSNYDNGKKILFKGPAGIGDRLCALVCYKVICDYLGYNLVMYNVVDDPNRNYDFKSLIKFKDLEFTDNPTEFDKKIHHFMYISPVNVFNALKVFIPDLKLKDVSDKYEEIFRSIEPSDVVKPENDLTDVYGVHLRKGDKVVSTSDDITNTQEELNTIIDKLLADIKYIIDNETNPKFLIVSDDMDWRSNFITKMKSLGNFEIVETKSINENYKGVDSINDIFHLSKCKKIFMGVKFSAFTIAAALMGNRPIVIYEDSPCVDTYKCCLNIEGKEKVYDEKMPTCRGDSYLEIID